VLARLFEAGASEIRLSGNALDGSLRMKLVREPRDVYQVLPLELLDSDRVDVTPGSNVIGEDDQLYRFKCVYGHAATIPQAGDATM
jgi:hypothetical protein